MAEDTSAHRHVWRGPFSTFAGFGRPVSGLLTAEGTPWPPPACEECGQRLSEEEAQWASRESFPGTLRRFYGVRP